MGIPTLYVASVHQLKLRSPKKMWSFNIARRINRGNELFLICLLISVRLNCLYLWWFLLTQTKTKFPILIIFLSNLLQVDGSITDRFLHTYCYHRGMNVYLFLQNIRILSFFFNQLEWIICVCMVAIVRLGLSTRNQAGS